MRSILKSIAGLAVSGGSEEGEGKGGLVKEIYWIGN